MEALTETKLKVGTIPLSPLLDAQERNRASENDLIENQLQGRLNEGPLYRALGGL